MSTLSPAQVAGAFATGRTGSYLRIMSSRPPLSSLVRVLVVLEVVLALGALAGGVALVADPSGGYLQMPLDVLAGTPFRSFLVPGLVLLLANGVLPLVVAAGALARRPWAVLGHVAAGVVLVGWILGQVALLGFVTWLQPAYLVYGLVLLGLGLWNWRAIQTAGSRR